MERAIRKTGLGSFWLVLLLVLELIVVAMLLACGARVRPSASQPGRPGTPLENIMAWNAAVANANLGLAKAVIAANETSPPLLDVPTANTILTEQSRIADANRQLTFILQTTCTQAPDPANPTKMKVTCLHTDQIHALLEQIKASAEKLTGDLGIKHAATRKTIAANAATAVTLIEQMLEVLKAVGILSSTGFQPVSLEETWAS